MVRGWAEAGRANMPRWPRLLEAGTGLALNWDASLSAASCCSRCRLSISARACLQPMPCSPCQACAQSHAHACSHISISVDRAFSFCKSRQHLLLDSAKACRRDSSKCWNPCLPYSPLQLGRCIRQTCKQAAHMDEYTQRATLHVKGVLSKTCQKTARRKWANLPCSPEHGPLAALDRCLMF